MEILRFVITFTLTFGSFGYLSASSSDACTTKLCHCYKIYANCSNRNLTYIPKLPSNINILNLNGNNIKRLSSKMSQNISTINISSVYLNNAGVRIIDNNAFQSFRDLKRIDLSFNELNEISLFNLTATLKFLNSLVYLRLKGIGLRKYIPTGLFKEMSRSGLNQLDLSENQLEFLNFTELKPLSRLNNVKVSSNKLKTVSLDYLGNMKELMLMDNHLTDIPNFCDPKFLTMPKLSKLTLIKNMISKFVPQNLECLKHMKRINLNKNMVSKIEKNAFGNMKLLTSVDLCCQLRSFSISDYAFNNSHIKLIALSDNEFEIEYIGKEAFSGLSSLVFLDLSSNSLSDYHQKTCERLNEILSPLESIENLLMASSSLNYIPDTLRTMKKLQQVSLYHNQITTWPGGFWKDTKLSSLDVRYNQIKSVSKEMIDRPLRDRIYHFAVGHNPLVCNCDLVWFIDWIHKNHSKFAYYPNGYQCLNITKRVCFNNMSLNQSVISVCSLFVFFLMTCSLLYKYRWLIKYQIYIWRRGHNNSNIVAGEFEYDVFVSYSVYDGDWVINNMLRIEDEEHLKFCIHERDFKGGKLVIDNIVESLENSRHVLIVLTNNFARSQWCQLELVIVQDYILRFRLNPPTVVLLEDIESENMSNTLNALMKNTTYITWLEDDQNSPIFWERLKCSLRNT